MTQTAAPAEITYRKTKAGEWVAYGPADSIHPGAVVTVTKKSGETTTERVARTGRTFEVDGVEMVYGYLDASEPRRPRNTRPASTGWAPSCGYPCPVDGHRCTPQHPCHDCL